MYLLEDTEERENKQAAGSGERGVSSEESRGKSRSVRSTGDRRSQGRGSSKGSLELQGGK